MANKIPLSVSSKLVNSTSSNLSLSVSAYANNTGKTEEDAPVLISVEATGSMSADEFASALAKNSAGGSEAEARLFVNAFDAVITELVQENGAVTVQTPFGTIETFIDGSVEDAHAEIDPATNVAYLAIVPPECYRREIAAIEPYIPSGACPASLKYVRDSVTGDNTIHGTRKAYLDGRNMSYGSTGEKLELYTLAGTKLCDVTVDTENKGPTCIPFTLPSNVAVAVGKYVLKLTTLAGGGEAGGTLWPLTLDVTVSEAIDPTIMNITDVSYDHADPNKIKKNSGFSAFGENLAYNAAWGDTITFHEEDESERHNITPSSTASGAINFASTQLINEYDTGSVIEFKFTLHGSATGAAQVFTKSTTLTE